MKLPIDLMAVIEAATDIESARSTSVSVSVLIDDSAPGDVAAHVRSAFVGAGAYARVTVGYFAGPAFSPYEGDDMAVIVAGFSEEVGRRAAEIRAAGVPVMVVTSMPSLVADMASAYGNPIPEGDLVAPEGVEGCEADGDAACESGEVAGAHVSVFAGIRAAKSAGAGAAAGSAGAQAASPDVLDAPIPIDAAAACALDRRMGEWVVAACREKRLALALSFPFVRKPLSLEAVGATSLQNAGIGIVLFIPGADMPLMTLNQAKMLLQIAAAYGEPMSAARVKELAAIVAGGFACRSVARQVAGAVPAIGWAVKAGVGYAGTKAMGLAAVEYFERGGNIAGLAGVVSSATAKATQIAGDVAATPAGARVLSTVKTAVRQGAASVLKKTE
ncbi:MAG: hypothetical protein Q4Q56_09335 [Coriobacteriia bacterium]|nr:hypothetical protein [Coriobacteriia bacterium]